MDNYRATTAFEVKKRFLWENNEKNQPKSRHSCSVMVRSLGIDLTHSRGTWTCRYSNLSSVYLSFFGFFFNFSKNWKTPKMLKIGEKSPFLSSTVNCGSTSFLFFSRIFLNIFLDFFSLKNLFFKKCAFCVSFWATKNPSERVFWTVYHTRVVRWIDQSERDLLAVSHFQVSNFLSRWKIWKLLKSRKVTFLRNLDWNTVELQSMAGSYGKSVKNWSVLDTFLNLSLK